MKKIFCIFMAIALCACMCACSGPEPICSSDTLFEVVARYADCSVLRCKETNVLYVDYSCGMSVLFNVDGTPMVWNGR